MTLKSILQKASVSSAAKSALYHWIFQRITAIALIPLGMWFVGMGVLFITAPFEITHEWLSSPFTATFVILFVFFMFYHGYLGMQVIWEDYISHKSARRSLMLVTQLFSLILALIAIISLLIIYIG